MLLLTAKDSIEDRVDGLDAGADDYLVKPFAFEELMARIRVMLRKKSGQSSNLLSVGDLTLDLGTHTVVRDGQPISLSSREFALLRYLVMNQGMILSRDQIEQHIWNYDYEGSSNMIDVYIRYLRKKIDDPFEKKLIHTVRGSGIRFAGGREEMKRISLKWKLTILYTLLMTLLTGLVLAVLLSLGSGRLLASAQAALRQRVVESFDLLESREGNLTVDSDFSDREGGIYLSAYDEDGLLLAGRVPYGFASAIDFQEDTVQTAELNGSRWYVYDASTQVRDYGTVYVRGVCSVSAVEEEMNTLVKLAVVLLPATVLLSAVLCYSLVRRTLRPVSRMTRTAREIYEKRDLSRRIGIEGGRDEISTLAETFDTMLEQLQASFEQQKQFTSDVSHELRTPMAVILSQCDYLLADPELSGKDREAIQIIREKAKNLTG